MICKWIVDGAGLEATPIFASKDSFWRVCFNEKDLCKYPQRTGTLAFVVLAAENAPLDGVVAPLARVYGRLAPAVDADLATSCSLEIVDFINRVINMFVSY